MDWQYNGEKVNDLPDDCVGFVYLITNLATGKMYIGKKLAKFAKTRYKTVVQKNGKKVKDFLATGKSSEISLSTLIISENGGINQTSVSNVIKKSCETLILNLFSK